MHQHLLQHLSQQLSQQQLAGSTAVVLPQGLGGTHLLVCVCGQCRWMITYGKKQLDIAGSNRHQFGGWIEQFVTFEAPQSAALSDWHRWARHAFAAVCLPSCIAGWLAPVTGASACQRCTLAP